MVEKKWEYSAVAVEAEAHWDLVVKLPVVAPFPEPRLRRTLVATAGQWRRHVSGLAVVGDAHSG